MKLKMPHLPGPKEYTVIHVNVAPGDRVQADQELFNAETSKGVVAVKAPFDGLITRVNVTEGEQISPRTIMGEMLEIDEDGNPIEDDWPEDDENDALE